MSDPAGQARARLAELTGQLATWRSRLQHLEEIVADFSPRWKREARGTYTAACASAESRRDGALRELDRSVSEARRRAQSVAENAAAELAPGCLGLPFGAAWSAPPGPRIGGCVRVGFCRTGSGEETAPVVLPLLGTAGWVVEAGDDSFAALAHDLALRLAYALGPGHLRLTCYDPGFVTDLGRFAGLREVDRETVPGALTATDELAVALDRMVTQVGKIREDLAAYGGGTLLEVARQDGTPPYPFQVLVLAGHPGGLSDRAVARVRQLGRAGAEAGVVVIAQGAAWGSLLGGTLQHVRIGDRCSSDALPGLAWDRDDPLDAAAARRLSQAAAGADWSSGNGQSFADLVQEIADPWVDAGDDGLEAVLGQAGRGDLVVRLRSADPPMPNAIIGGAVGQGKSNLLLVLIHALAARYSPADLQFVLLDLKDGVEFARLGPDPDGSNWLPHARVLGLDFDVDFCLATLGWLLAETTARAALFREAGVSSIGAYRRRTCQSIPRLALVVDEFQRIFEGDTDSVEQAASMLESLARTGRTYGIHLVLASQTLSGIRGLAVKSDAIFAQFHNRISLKNTPAESQAILAPHNTAAAALSAPGEVIINDALGDPEANRRGRVAYAEPEYLHRLRTRWWRDAAVERPAVFKAAEFAAWPESRAPANVLAGVRVVLGAPISPVEEVRSADLLPAAEQALVVVGPDSVLARPVLARMLSTAVTSSSAAVEVVLLDGLSGAAEGPFVARLSADLGHRGASVVRVPRARVAEWCDAFDPAASETRTIVVPLALDGVKGLTEPQLGRFEPPVERLREWVRVGAIDDVYVLGWWQSRHQLEHQLGFGVPGVRGFLLAGLGREDVHAVCGPSVTPPRGAPRVLWYDRAGVRGAEPLVPFAWREAA